MSTAITWAMTKTVPPPPGLLLEPSESVDIRFILLDRVVLQVIWQGSEWIADWAFSGSNAAEIAERETRNFEREGYTLTGPIHTATATIEAVELYGFAAHSSPVNVAAILPGPWEQA